MYTHVCTCKYMYVHVCTCMYMYVHVCTYMYKHDLRWHIFRRIFPASHFFFFFILKKKTFVPRIIVFGVTKSWSRRKRYFKKKQFEKKPLFEIFFLRNGIRTNLCRQNGHLIRVFWHNTKRKRGHRRKMCHKCRFNSRSLTQNGQTNDYKSEDNLTKKIHPARAFGVKS